MYDSKLPSNMWDLSVYAATYAYNRTPHVANNMEAPLKVFAPNHSFDMKQIKRCGCLAYVTVQRKVGPKFKFVGRRVIFVGYTPTGYLFLMPEDGKFYENRNADFNEKLVYGEKYNSQSIKDWVNDNEAIDKHKWLVEFDDGKVEESSKTEGVVEKRGRGRPKKISTQTASESKTSANQIGSVESIDSTSVTHTLRVKESDKEKALQESDERYFVLLAQINQDPINIKEVMNSSDRDEWLAAIKSEFESMESNHVWDLVDRPTVSSNGTKPNIFDSRWVFKNKMDENGLRVFKARLVIRGFNDTNEYDLRETYAPVSRLPLIRALFSIINKMNLDVYQLDVKTAFLNGELEEEIFMEIPDGMFLNSNTKPVNKMCRLRRVLFGLRISPKRCNDKFTQVILEAGLTRSSLEPCLFIWFGDKDDEGKIPVVYLLLYVDDILLAGNNKAKMQEVKDILKKEFEMKDLGEPKQFLGMRITRNREEKILQIDQEQFINKIIEKFCSVDKKYAQRTL